MISQNSELFQLMRLKCERRGKNILNVESVALSMRISFGLADATPLLAAAANTFYFVKSMHWSAAVSITGNPTLRATDLGGGSGGNIDIFILTGLTSGIEYFGLECSSLTYHVNTFSAGSFILIGEVYKITHSA